MYPEPYNTFQYFIYLHCQWYLHVVNSSKPYTQFRLIWISDFASIFCFHEYKMNIVARIGNVFMRLYIVHDMKGVD